MERCQIALEHTPSQRGRGQGCFIGSSSAGRGKGCGSGGVGAAALLRLQLEVLGAASLHRAFRAEVSVQPFRTRNSGLKCQVQGLCMQHPIGK